MVLITSLPCLQSKEDEVKDVHMLFARRRSGEKYLLRLPYVGTGY